MGGSRGIWTLTFLILLVGCSSTPTGEVVTEPTQVVEETVQEQVVETVEEVPEPEPAPEPVEESWDDLSKLDNIMNCNDPRPSSCPFDKEFVCGSDGKTYKNACVACMNNGVSWVLDGAC